MVRMSFTSYIIDSLDTFLLWIFQSSLKIIDFYNRLQWTIQNTVWVRPILTKGSDLNIEIWELSIADGISAAIHGQFERLTEFYFPELNYSFNYHNGHINHILDPKKRYTFKNSRFSSKDAQPKFIRTEVLSGQDAHNVRAVYNHIKASHSSDSTMRQIAEKLSK